MLVITSKVNQVFYQLSVNPSANVSQLTLGYLTVVSKTFGHLSVVS